MGLHARTHASNTGQKMGIHTQTTSDRKRGYTSTTQAGRTLTAHKAALVRETQGGGATHLVELGHEQLVVLAEGVAHAKEVVIEGKALHHQGTTQHKMRAQKWVRTSHNRTEVNEG